jgi:hypothetical protein
MEFGLFAQGEINEFVVTVVMNMNQAQLADYTFWKFSD